MRLANPRAHHGQADPELLALDREELVLGGVVVVAAMKPSGSAAV